MVEKVQKKKRERERRKEEGRRGRKGRREKEKGKERKGKGKEIWKLKDTLYRYILMFDTLLGMLCESLRL